MIFVLMSIVPCFNFKQKYTSRRAFTFFLDNPFYTCHFMKLFMFEIMLVTLGGRGYLLHSSIYRYVSFLFF